MSGDDVVAAARAWLGTPYRHQAATLGAGCDCLGLLRGVWRTLFGEEPPPAPNYRADWRDTRNAGELQAMAKRLLRPTSTGPTPGNVIFFQVGPVPAPKHCGIAVTDQRFIHAQEGLGVVEANLTDGWSRRIVALYDFPEREPLRQNRQPLFPGTP